MVMIKRNEYYDVNFVCNSLYKTDTTTLIIQIT